MAIERAPDWADTIVARGPERASAVDPAIVDLVADRTPGKALDLGCGCGQDSVWLAQRGWDVTAVEASPEALDGARDAASQAGVSIVFHVADLPSFRPTSRFDLVILTYALPARGMGRSRTLETAAAAVAPGGLILVTDLDISLGRERGMAEKHLVSRDELERHLDGFRILRSATRLAKRPHGYEELVLPVASVIASRRTDLRTL